jgi:hypothetical protein
LLGVPPGSVRSRDSVSRRSARGALTALAAAATLALLAPAPALAYLDPGSGSVLLQLLLGGAAGVAVAARLLWQRLRRRLLGRERAGSRALSLPPPDERSVD